LGVANHNIPARSCKRLGRSVEFIEKLIACDPEHAIAILEEGAYVHPTEAVGVCGIVNENLEVVAVEPVQSILRAKPHEALTALHDLGYLRLR
jgi:hypothetical protein